MVIIITGGVAVVAVAVVAAVMVITPGKTPERIPKNPPYEKKGDSPWGF